MVDGTADFLIHGTVPLLLVFRLNWTYRKINWNLLKKNTTLQPASRMKSSTWRGTVFRREAGGGRRDLTLSRKPRSCCNPPRLLSPSRIPGVCWASTPWEWCVEAEKAGCWVKHPSLQLLWKAPPPTAFQQKTMHELSRGFMPSTQGFCVLWDRGHKRMLGFSYFSYDSGDLDYSAITRSHILRDRCERSPFLEFFGHRGALDDVCAKG